MESPDTRKHATFPRERLAHPGLVWEVSGIIRTIAWSSTVLLPAGAS